MNCYGKTFTSERKANRFMKHLEECGIEAHSFSATNNVTGRMEYRVTWFAESFDTGLVWVD